MNIRRIKENATKMFCSQLFWIQVCAVGIWLLVIQNYFGDEDTAQRVVRMLTPLAEIKNITLQIDASDPCPILCSEDDLYQIHRIDGDCSNMLHLYWLVIWDRYPICSYV